MPERKKQLQINDPRIVAALHDVFEERVSFNKALAMKIVSLDPAAPSMRIDMRPDLVGNFARGMLHGGVISSVLDVVSGLCAMLNVIEKHIAQGEPLETQMARFGRIGTIDLRVDFLRPGLGNSFVAKAEILRAGNRVAVIRSELHNEEQVLIAAAVAAFTIS